MNRIKTKAYLEVTLEQAREWYESGNEDLKKLALTAFSEEMLIPSFKEIVESEEDYGFWNTLVCRQNNSVLQLVYKQLLTI